jgi:hypothetical protein
MSQGLTGVPQALSYTANVASATTVTLPNAPMDATYPVTGTTTITGITSGQAGRKARLIFQSAGCTVINGSNLKLAGRSFISTVNRMLTLVSDGTNWIEESRGDFGTTAPAALTLGGVTANGTVGESADIGHVHAFPIPAPTIAGVLGTDGTSAIWFPAPDLNINYNGAAEVQQGGSSFSALVSGTRYIDGWLPLKIGTGVLSVATTTSPTTVLATGHMPLSSYQFITTTTVDASIGIGDVYGYETVIEGWNARRLVAGSALSFWCYSTRGGTFTAFMQTYAGTHSYIREFVMPVNTWTYVTTTFPAWTAIDGNMSTNIGAYVGICMAGGTNFHSHVDHDEQHGHAERRPLHCQLQPGAGVDPAAIPAEGLRDRACPSPALSADLHRNPGTGARRRRRGDWWDHGLPRCALRHVDGGGAHHDARGAW